MTAKRMRLIIALQMWRVRRWPGHVLSIVAPLLALGVRLAMGDHLVGYPFVTFFPAVLLTAGIGSPGAAGVTLLLSACLAEYFLVEPAGMLIPQTLSDWIGLVLFLIVSATIIGLVHGLNLALDQLLEARAAMERLNAELENRVTIRASELTAANVELRSEIAAREAAETLVRQQQKMQVLGELTGGIAHDFNNMLSVVIGNLDLMKRQISKGGMDILSFVDHALEGANRCATLTHRLLAFARQQPLAPTVTDANALVRGMEELLRRTLGETIALECVLGGGLWRTTVDANQLENALLNLAVNARDAMPAGGRLTVETMNVHLDDDYVAAEADVAPGQYVLVAVSDTGEGMPPEVVKRAFDPFFTTKPAGSGTGLGLSQIYGFVKQSGGHVKIYSEPGHGTTVKIYLKREYAPQAGLMTSGRPEQQLAVPLACANEIILVVEDEAAVRRTTVHSLRALGYTVRHADTGAAALSIAAELPQLSLLLTDVVMPGLSGRELANALCAHRPGLKVLFITGYTPNAIVHGGVIDAGVELLSKPFTLDQLSRKIRKVLDQ